MSLIKKLRKELLLLNKEHSVVGMKGGTEVEDMSFKELSFLHSVTKDIVPLVVKIGGPEARNDIREILNIGVEGIIAPMIESEYSLENFVKTMFEYDAEHYCYKGINIETKTGCKEILEILNSKYFDRIAQVTIGRSDLAKSLKANINDDVVFETTSKIVNLVRKKEKISSVGGNINPENALLIREKINPHRINSRHISIDLILTKNLSESVIRSLKYEIELCKAFADIEPSKHQFYSKRIHTMEKRLQTAISSNQTKIKTSF